MAGLSNGFESPLHSCPVECYLEEYKSTVSAQEISHEVMSRIVQAANITEDEKKVVKPVMFQVYYPKFDFIKTVQHPTVRG